MFISLEGPDGSGKTSQIAPLVARLEGEGYDVLVTREPGGTAIGDEIRDVIMDLGHKDVMVARSEILLFQASRAQLVEQVIRPALAAGKVVLCDRYADSTYAYQGYGHNVDLAELRRIVEFATGGLVPDKTILFDVDAKTGLERRGSGGEWNRLDDYDLEFHQRVQRGYHELVAAEPERWVNIDATRSEEEVAEDLLKAVLGFLPK